MLLIEQLHQHKPKGDLGASTGPLHRGRAMTLPRASPLSTAPPGPRHAAPPELRRLHTPHIHRAAPPAGPLLQHRLAALTGRKKKLCRRLGLWGFGRERKSTGATQERKAGAGAARARRRTKTLAHTTVLHAQKIL
jgi:hypothetical protein